MRALSAFVLDLNAQAQDHGMAGLVDWAVTELSDLIGFDSAWYGWAQIQTTSPVIHSSSLLNLPNDFFAAWTEISHQDVLVNQFVEDPLCVPTYDRQGTLQTDGMGTLADRYGIRKMATAMCLREARSASLYVSAYRSGQRAKNWSQEEKEFLQCAVDNISAAARIAAMNDLHSQNAQAATFFLSAQGATIIGLSNVRERFGHLWASSDGDQAPRWLAGFLDQPGEHVLVDRDLVASCEQAKTSDGQSLYKVSLRPLRKFDLLTARERDVAAILASGKTHKETARLLGVAPSTIRNQTQSIYEKLCIDNRASLTKHVLS
mgnify:CR=1 FL=1